MAGRIVVVGSVNTDLIVQVDRFPLPGETLVGRSFSTSGGGKGANQAIAAARLGGNVAMISAVGRDANSDQRLADFRSAGVDVTQVERHAELPGGVALIQVNATGENCIVIIPGAYGALRADAVRRAIAAIVTPDDLVACQLEIPFDAVAAALETGRSVGARTVLNAAPALDRAGELLALVDTLIVNEVEASQIGGGPAVDPDSVAAIAETLHARGPSSVIVTLGEAGAYLRSPDIAELIPAKQVKVVDTTGAGDAFVGAVLAWLADGRPLREAVQSGVVAGGLAVQQLGAQPSLPTAEAVRAAWEA